MTQPNPDEGRIDDYEGEGGAVVNAADGLDPTNIASVDKAIVSFSTAEVNNIYSVYNIKYYIHNTYITKFCITVELASFSCIYVEKKSNCIYILFFRETLKNLPRNLKKM